MLPVSFYKCKDVQNVPDVVHSYNSDVCCQHTPLIIDNGSYQCRAGWASSSRPELTYKNVIAKNRGNRKEKDWDIQVANDISDLETVRWLLRTPYDFNVVVNYSVQETLLDYAFKHLGIDSDGCVDHPLVITEAIANPTYCRKQMSELLFEAYSIPKLTYGIDCLFSYGLNAPNNTLPETALIISSGFQSTHVLPIVNGRADIKHCCRINLGGYNCSAYLQRLLQLKHTQCMSEFTLSRMDEVINRVCTVATNYSEEVTKWTCDQYRKKHTCALQFSSGATTTHIKSSALLDGPLKLEKKLKQTEYKLHELECVIDLEHENPEAALKLAADAGCSNVDELKQIAEKIRLDIENIRVNLDEEYQLDNNNALNNVVKCGIEKYQAPEILFQPSLVGYQQCGISDCIESILQKYSSQVQEVMAQNVFITGGNTKIKGFKERVVTDLIQIRPHNSKINVAQAADPSLDTWKGAAKWALSQQNFWMTRNDFNECGWDYLKVHKYSNPYVAIKS